MNIVSFRMNGELLLKRWLCGIWKGKHMLGFPMLVQGRRKQAEFWLSFGSTIFVQVSLGSLKLITLIRKINLKGQERIGSNSPGRMLITSEALSPVAGEHP